MMRQWIFWLSVALCCGCWQGCSRAEAQKGKLVITGSSTVAPLAAEIGKRYEQKNPGLRIDVQAGGSSRGIADTRRGIAHIGMASRELKADESDLRYRTIASDGIAVIVHRDNPLESLTVAQIVAIYRGESTDWRQVGGTPAPITVVHKAAGRSTLELFLKFFALSDEEVVASVIIGDNQQGIKLIGGNPHAIGYVSIGSAAYAKSVGSPIKLLPLNGVMASAANVFNGQYGLARPLNLVYLPNPPPLVKAFLDFASSADVADLVEAQYFVPISR